ncbi:MAG TPA: hypothetical protein PLQ36_01360 [Candidatus Gracilibacteria bacterium]|nr:hypothetical protein [Candidatus Gracilibacteria bacterium]
MDKIKTYIIDGNYVNSLSDFIHEFTNLFPFFIDKQALSREELEIYKTKFPEDNLNRFDDWIYELTLKEKCILKIINSQIIQKKLDYEAQTERYKKELNWHLKNFDKTNKYYEINKKLLEAKIQDCKNQKGNTLFIDVLEIIESNRNIQLILE